jgi:hypothetical protein
LGRRARLLATLVVCAQLSAAFIPCELTAAPKDPMSSGGTTLTAHCPCHIGDSPAPTPSAHWDAALAAQAEPQPVLVGPFMGDLPPLRVPSRTVPGPEPVPLV